MSTPTILQLATHFLPTTPFLFFKNLRSNFFIFLFGLIYFLSKFIHSLLFNHVTVA